MHLLKRGVVQNLNIEKIIENPDSLVRLWREKSAYRVGLKICYAGVVLALIATAVDIRWSPVSVIYTDLVLLTGCFLSLLWTRHHGPTPYFCWWPIYIGFWISTLPSLYSTGGTRSPFFGLLLAVLFLLGVASQVKIRPRYFMIFVFAHVPVLFLLEKSNLIPVSPPISPVFSSVITTLLLTAIILSMLEFLRTERELAKLFALRYEELAHAKAELQKEEAANAAKTTFLANISHELRTPMAAILGYSELMLNPDLNEGDKTPYGETIHRNAQRLSRLLDDLLDLSKVETGNVEVDKSELVLKELLIDVKESIELLAQKKDLNLNIKYGNTIPKYIYSDPMRVRQILINVIGNAIKFTEKGSVDLVLEYLHQSNDNTLLISVADTGRGLTMQEQGRLFKPFTQGDPSMARRYGGTGLGLSLSRSLARLLGGDLYLENSKMGEGSTFVLRLPVGDVKQQSWEDSFTEKILPEEQKPLSHKEHNPSLAGMKVLVVDDTPDNQKLIRVYLQAEGAEVEVAGDGFEGVKKAIDGHYDVVLMDIQMPLLDGYEAVATLRKREYRGPIFALTAHAMKEDRDRCLAVGCNAHLTKPIDRHVLTNALQNLRAP